MSSSRRLCQEERSVALTTRAPDWRSNDEMRPPSEPDFFKLPLQYMFKKEDSEGRAARGAYARRSAV